MTRFLLISFGNAAYLHWQASFAIISILAHVRSPANVSFNVLTDHPEWYAWLSDYVEIVPVDRDVLNDWRGPYDFFWRIKLRAMQHVHEAGGGDLIYLDTDVVCRTDLQDLFEALESGQCLMHTREYALASDKNGTAKKMWQQVGHRTYGGLTVDNHSAMWNAGVVAIPDEHCERYLRDAVTCCDAMCEDGITRKLIEQFSLSLTLAQDQPLQPADKWFVHYWGNKPPWNALIATFLSDVLLKQESVETACERITSLPLDMPVTIKRTRLERLANSVTKRLRRRDNIVEQTVTDWLTR